MENATHWLVYRGQRFIGIIETNFAYYEPYWTARGCRLVPSNDYQMAERVEMAQYLASRRGR
jgi:hypothetical protein